MNPNDRLVRDRHLLRIIEIAKRRKVEPVVPNGDGHIIRGSMFDCNHKDFERVLTDYWDKLFVGWNPYKNNGLGCWEVWQRPSTKTPVKQAECKYYSVWTLEDKYSDFEHHVQDLPYLSYNFINRLREMDAWHNTQLLNQMDDAVEENEKKAIAIEAESIKYAVRHNKSVFNKLKGLAQDGYNPLWFFSDKRQGDGEA